MIAFPRWMIWTSWAVCLLAILVALPNVLPAPWREAMPNWLPKSTLNLGLDLQGGSYLLLEADLDAVYREKLETTRDDIRTKLRAQDIGYTNLVVQGTDKVQVKIRDAAQMTQADEILKGMISSVEAGLLGGGANNYELTSTPDGVFVFTMTDGARVYYQKQTIAQSIEIVRRRIDELGTKEPTIQQQGPDRILVQVPGAPVSTKITIYLGWTHFDVEMEDANGPGRLKNILGKTAKLQFRFVDEGADIKEAMAGRVPPGTELLYEVHGEQKFPLVIEKRVIVSGDQLVNAQQSFDGQSGRPVVSFAFDAEGARRFGDATKNNVGRRFAIVLDNEVVSAPRIEGPIMAGNGQITGGFTVQTASDLAIVLRAGALPAPLKIVEERTVGAELGADSIKAGTYAAVAGVLATLVLLVASYGLFGVFAVVGLLLNLVITIALMTMLGATMTLPGIAGLVLSIGMTVDANVLFYERIREERDNGKPIVSSLSSGFSGAMSAITDANVTQLLACVILFQLGSGPVRGFAVTLGLGIAVSMFTAVLLTRMMVVSWFRWRRPRVLPI